VSPVYWGVVASIATSIGAGYLFSFAANQALWEGVLALAAAVLVSSLVVHMWRIARTLKRQIQERLNSAAEAGSSRLAWLGIFMFTILMITREGMETALLLGTLMFQMNAPDILAGALLGVVFAGILALAWVRYGHRIDLARLLQVTSVFLLVFAAQLLIYGVHELSEASVLPYSMAIHDATEPYGPDGLYGQWLSFALIAAPLGWLAISYLRSMAPGRRSVAAART
jgi:high-affinity iron transporter